MAGRQTVAVDWDRLGKQPKPRGGQNSDRPLAQPRIALCVCVCLSVYALPWLIFLLMIKMLQGSSKSRDVLNNMLVFRMVWNHGKQSAGICEVKFASISTLSIQLCAVTLACTYTTTEKKNANITFPPGNLGNTQFQSSYIEYSCHSTLSHTII